MLLYILVVIFLLVGVAFFTLLEQNLLSYIQLRKGPNKAGVMGLLQPFSDAIKLFSKEKVSSNTFYVMVYNISPVLSLFISLVMWVSFPLFFNILNMWFGFLFIMSCMSLGVYFLLFLGWPSGSSYAFLGSVRAVAQTISYEVCMILLFMYYFLLLGSLNLYEFFFVQKYMNFLWLNVGLSIILIISFLAETNRAPFDFSEGESELVSGFNIEYSGGEFAMIFLSEYSNILFLSMFFCSVMLFNSTIYFLFFIKICLVGAAFIWVRGVLPRFRYDALMMMMWKIFLPLSLLFLMNMLLIKVLFSM